MYIDYTEQELVDALRRNGEKIGKQAQEDNTDQLVRMATIHCAVNE